MQTILTVVHVVLAIGLIALVLLQHGKGADAGAAFGSGASATVFGARGSGSFLTRSTSIIATLFFLTSMALAYFAAKVGEPSGLMDGIDLPTPAANTAPVLPAVGDLPAGDVPAEDLPVTDLPPVVAQPPTGDAGAAESDVPSASFEAEAGADGAAATDLPVVALPADVPAATEAAGAGAGGATDTAPAAGPPAAGPSADDGGAAGGVEGTSRD